MGNASCRGILLLLGLLTFGTSRTAPPPPWVAKVKKGRLHVALRTDVRGDYKRLFGTEAPAAVEGVRFQVNSQYTHTTASACLAEMSFL